MAIGAQQASAFSDTVQNCWLKSDGGLSFNLYPVEWTVVDLSYGAFACIFGGANAIENSSLIGALAIFTIGAGLVGAIVYFGYFLQNPKNRQAAQRVARDDISASTSQREDSTHGRGLASVKQRLDHSKASAHPDDPTRDTPAP